MQTDKLKAGKMSEKLKPSRFAWTPGVGSYKYYPPYVNLTGNRLTVRGPETEDGKCGEVVAVELPDEALAELHAATRPLSMTGEGWQPIETAPKDGRCVLLTDPDGRLLSGWHTGTRWLLATQDGEPVELWSPTYWQPLPEPPAAIQEQSK